jgi:hypothetical protein
MIDREEAIEIARARATQNGWGFGQPLQVIHRRPWFKKTGGRFEIETNANRLGTKARFVVDEDTGAILDEGYIPR